MKKKKLSLKSLEISSFITNIDNDLSKTVKGGSTDCVNESYYCQTEDYYCDTTDETNSNKVGCKWSAYPTYCLTCVDCAGDNGFTSTGLGN